ncbi:MULTISPECIES: hypothetical protein [Cellulomonas]|uniref:hypothetical protein n=1 Tax=Cellulomonas TaxID=1707 RepID=UPI0010A91D4B|nr:MULTISPECIES: hypothetical protein [Cellulomonas]
MTENPDVPTLEQDETVPPRPEEEAADLARSRPDPAGHGDERRAAADLEAVDGLGESRPEDGPTAREVG